MPTEWGGTERETMVAMLRNCRVNGWDIGEHFFGHNKLVAAGLDGYERALAEMEEALTELLEWFDDGQYPEIRTMLAKYRLPTTKGTDHA